MDKMDKYGMDLEKVNIERLKEIFPECVTDGKVNFDVLRTILGDDVETSGEKYSFNWVGKSDAMKIALMPSTGTLRPCKDKSKDWDKTENLYIEGDNLEVLKILEKTYHNKIKMIYIDPPYNTGNDFVYHDDFHDNVQNYLDNSSQAFRTNPETAGRFHTDWLNMLYPRLKIARELLTDDGIIFISIDDNEVCNLKKICDEIFGATNFIAQIVIDGTPKNDPKIISTAHEYCLVYVKDYEKAKEGKWGVYNFIYKELLDIVASASSYKEAEDNVRKYYKANRLTDDNISNYNRVDEKGLFRIGPIDDPQSGGARDVRYNPFTGDALKTPNRGWGCSIETWNEWVKNGEILFPDDNSKLCSRKVYISADKLDLLRAYFKMQIRKDTDMLKELFGKKVFSFPKPVELIKSFIDSSVKKHDIVLDFFSGSGTTAHAVMQLNAERIYENKYGQVKFILVQLQEDLYKNLACAKGNREKQTCQNAIDFCLENELEPVLTSIGEERIRRSGEKIKEALRDNATGISMLAKGVKTQKSIVNDDGKTVAQISITGMFDAPENVDEVNNEMADKIDVGFKVFKLDSTNIKPWDATIKYDETTLYDLQDSVVKEDRSNLDIAYEVMLKYGIFNMPLEEKEVNGKTVYSVGEGYMIISLNDEITTEDVAAIAALNPKAVVFKESGFVNDNAKMNADYTFKRLGIDNVKCI